METYLFRVTGKWFEIIVCCLVPVSLLQLMHRSVSVCECVKESGGSGHGVTGLLVYYVSVYRVCVCVCVRFLMRVDSCELFVSML